MNSRGQLSPPEYEMRTVLRDDIIHLRPFAAQDVFDLYSATRETIGSLCEWMLWCHPDYSLEDCRNFLTRSVKDWDSEASYNFAIVDVKTGEVCGSISLNRINRAHRVANVGYWVRQSQAGRGIASRALRLVARYGLHTLSLKRIEVLVPEGNLASQRVAQKAGATFEGVLNQKLKLNGKAHDGLMFAIFQAKPLRTAQQKLYRRKALRAPGLTTSLSRKRMPAI